MSNRNEILTPVGRLVGGSLYEAQTTDAEGKPLTVRNGVNAGQPRVDYFFAIAIPKGNEQHWNQTSWGMKIYKTGQDGFPGGQYNSPHFAWKVKDGDDAIPNRVGRRNCDREGYPGHWILHFTSGFAPTVFNENGSKQIVEKDYVNLGDYIQVYGNVSDNGSTQQPGIFLNHQYVAFRAYGQRIVLGIDPKTVGFGNDALPTGASLTPPASGFNPAAVQPSSMSGYATPPNPSAPPIAAPPPHPAILNPVPAPARVMLPAANGASYESLIALGWTDALLIQHGYMQA